MYGVSIFIIVVMEQNKEKRINTYFAEWEPTLAGSPEPADRPHVAREAVLSS
jgi:hypothetical protein